MYVLGHYMENVLVKFSLIKQLTFSTSHFVSIGKHRKLFVGRTLFKESLKETNF